MFLKRTLSQYTVKHFGWSHGPLIERSSVVCVIAGDQVDRALDSRSEGLGFNPSAGHPDWPCFEVSGKLCIPHYLGPPSCNGYLEPGERQSLLNMG